MNNVFARRIVVTGGAGFIGSNFLNAVVPRYADEQFINVDTLTYAANPANIVVSEMPNYQFEKTDIRDIPALSKIFETYRPTDIIHFAAESHVDQSILEPSVCFETNVIGTHNLLRLAREHRVTRFHLISTDEVYGSLNADGRPFSENDPYKPRNPYSASKASAELIARSYQETFGLPLVITRSSNNYGPRQDTSKFIPKLIANALSDTKAPIYSKGEHMRDWLYVGDCVEAIDQVFRNGRNGEAYNIGGGQEHTNLEVARKVLSLLSKTEDVLEFVADRPGHDFRYALSNQKIETELGWKPATRFEDGIEKTIDFYREKLRT